MKRLLFVFLSSFSITVWGQQFFDEKALIGNLKFLSSDSLEGRKTGSGGNAKARAFIKDQFRKGKLKTLGNDYELPFDVSIYSESKKGVNLAGVVYGKSKSGKYIVVSAHYDHEGIKNGIVYNGADDNASGVSALFALAEYFQKNKPVHNIIFVAFDAEEIGLQGAKIFVKKPPVPLDQILVNINMDMVSRADNNQLVACGTYYYPQLRPFLEKAGNQEKIKMIFGHDDPKIFKGDENWTQSSDHAPFHLANIPFVYFGVMDHKDYHQPTDDFEKIKAATYINCIKLIVRALVEIDKGLK